MTRPRALILVGAVAILSVATAGSWLLSRPAGRPGQSPTAVPGSNAPSGSLTPGGLTTASFGGPVYDATLNHEPTAGANQAKVWSAAGHWWATIIEPTSHELRIARFDAITQQWVDTGVVVDERPRVRAAVDWDGRRLSIVTAGSKAAPSQALRFTSYHYDPTTGRFVIDADVPIPLSALGVATPTLARDTDGVLWLAAVVDGRLIVRHTLGDDHHWSADMAAAIDGTDGVTRTATLAAGGDRVVLAWSRTTDGTLHLAEHADGAALESWTVSTTEATGLHAAPGDLSVAVVAGTPAPRVLVAYEAAPDPATQGSSLAPGALVVTRSPDGTWSTAQLGRTKDHLRTPVLAVDATRRLVLAIAATSDGQVVVKPADLDRPTFESGIGRIVIEPAKDGVLQNPSTVSGPIDLAGGLLVLAADDKTGRYAGGLISLGGIGPGPSAGPSTPPSPSGSAGPSTPPGPSPRPVTLLTDAFDIWAIGTAPPTWTAESVSAGRGRLTIVAAPSERNRSLHVQMTSAAGSLRACTTFPATATDLTVTETFRVDRIGSTDTTIGSVRGPGGEAASVRVTRHGLLAAYGGAVKRVSTRSIRLGTWYRSRIVVHPATHTYDWTITTTAGAVVTGARGVPWRDLGMPALDSVCIQTAQGVGAGLTLDTLAVVR